LKFLIPVLFAALLVCSTARAQTQPPIRVLCGGPAYKDSKGQMWMADTGYNDGTASKNSAAIKGTADASLYHYGRYNALISNPLTYTFPLPGALITSIFTSRKPRLRKFMWADGFST
jgi:hypothetical protein